MLVTGEVVELNVMKQHGYPLAGLSKKQEYY